MAQTVYTGKVAITTLVLREKAYDSLALLCFHLKGFPGVDIVSIVVDQGTHVITVTLTAQLPNPAQVDHLGLQ